MIPEMSDEERQQYREALKNMTEDEIRRIPDEKFSELMNWIITDMSYVLDKKDHRLVMSMVSSEYPNWYAIFVERFD
jgi:hypothetical protein